VQNLVYGKDTDWRVSGKGTVRKIFSDKLKKQEDGEIYTMKHFRIRTVQQNLLGRYNGWGHAARMGKLTYKFNILVTTPEGR
jgi:hypothetical protein